jgi:hypothetical protein
VNVEGQDGCFGTRSIGRQARSWGVIGGISEERWIRRLDVLLESATYRFYVALPAIRAIRPDDHCTLLQTRASLFRGHRALAVKYQVPINLANVEFKT